MQFAESAKGSMNMIRKARKRGTGARRHDIAKVMVVTAVSRSGASVASIVEGKKLSKQDAVLA
jgi:hypothetical protein